MSKKLIFLGPPGAGKGTLAARAVDIVKVPHISTGNIFREAMAAKTALGLTVKAVIDAGKLVDDGTTIALVKDRLSQDDAREGYILDGFPRTIPQAEALADFSAPDRVINFDLADAIILQRLGGRRTCRNCGANFHILFSRPKKENTCDSCGGDLYIREDDKKEAIVRRLEVYREQTSPLIGYYRERGLLVNVDAAPPPVQVVENFKTVLGIQ
ncbi:MAG: adenylate kinase [Spirochaetaceae bacterium]|jgi:adenylate kinase|nr:adenylate kinase [Spirochaetaceae bacterium]